VNELHGVVVDFDERRGDGTIKSDQGESFYFHCIEIADGSRFIRVGARVRAQRESGHLGRDEACRLTPEEDS